VELLQLSRGQVEFLAAIQRRLLKGLKEDAELSQRVMRGCRVVALVLVRFT
jgi:hypothetical protein